MVNCGSNEPFTYSWSPSTGLNNPNIQNPVAAPNSTTNYTVVATDAMGCTASEEVEVTVLPQPEPGISPANAVITCANPSVVLTAAAAESWLWSTSETTQGITVTAAGTYFVTITSANGCRSNPM